MLNSNPIRSTPLIIAAQHGHAAAAAMLIRAGAKVNSLTINSQP